MTIELKSETLDALLNKKAHLEKNIAAEKSTVQRLSRNQNTGLSIRRWTEDAQGNEIGNPRQSGPIPTPYDEDDERQRAETLRRTLAGEPLEFVDHAAELALAHKRWKAFEIALEHVDQAIYRERNVLGKQYCKDLKPKHDQLKAALCKKLVDLYPIHAELAEMRRELIDNGVMLHGLCLTMPDGFLGHPLNKWSDQGDFLRQAKADGYIDSIPSSFS